MMKKCEQSAGKKFCAQEKCENLAKNYKNSFSRGRIKALLLRPRCYCGCDVLIEKWEKFTIQNVSLNAAIEEILLVKFIIYLKKSLH